MYEVWKVEGRNRVLVARFRMRLDADRFVSAFGHEAVFELIDPAPQTPAPSSRGRRHRSGVVCASQHPDEFIADQTVDSVREPKRVSSND